MLTSYIYGSILKMLLGSKAHILFSLCWDRKEDTMLLKLIMLDESGNETIVETYNVRNDINKTFMDVWEDKTIEAVAKEHPEACGFYFEKSRDIQSMIDSEDECDAWEEKSLDDMILCDYRGICAGMSCPMYWKCRH